MASNSGNPTSPNLGALLEELMSAGIEFLLVGGLAAVVQGAPVTTMDVDVVHRRTPDNIARLIAFLKSVDAVYRRPDGKVIRPKEGDLFGEGHGLFTTRLGPLDILAVIEEGKGYEALLEHTVEIDFRGGTIKVLSLKTLIELKRTSKDPKDRQKLPVLEEALRQLEEGES